MTTLQNEFLLQECEINPNKKNFITLHIAMGAILVAWIANEIGMYQVDSLFVRIASIVALFSTMAPLFLALQQNWASRKNMKHLFVGSALVTTAAYVICFSFHATLVMVFPYLVVMHYRDVRLGRTVMIFSSLIAFFGSVISYRFGAWDPRFLDCLLHTDGLHTVSAGAVSSSGLSSFALFYALPNTVLVVCIGFAVVGAIRSNWLSTQERYDTLEKEQRIESMQENMLTNMAIVIENRDGNTGAHVYNVKSYVKLIVDYILDNHLYPETVTREYATMLINASVIHDVGKVAVPDEILHITGKYTPEQYRIMQSHAIKGEQIVLNTFGKNMTKDEVKLLCEIAGTHHERWDGNGYPRGLRGEEIPLAGRIMAVADVFDALISMRVYKESMTVDQAFDVLVQDSGTHFDKSIVAIFLSLRPKVEEIVEISRKAEYNV